MKNFILILASIGMMMLFTSSVPQKGGNNPGQSDSEHKSNLPDLSAQLRPGMIVIKFKEDASLRNLVEGTMITGISSVDEKMAAVGAVGLVKRFKHKPIPPGSGLPDISRIYRLSFPMDKNPAEVAALFGTDSNLEYAEPEPAMKICLVPNDPMYVAQQHLPQVMAGQAWDIHKGENGTTPVKIAIVDTGVEWTHVDLKDNVWENLGEDADGDGHTVQLSMSGLILDPGDLNGIDDDGNGFTDDLIGWDFYDAHTSGNGSNPNPNSSSSVGYHGTHCAGIATASTDNGVGVAGISWNLKYMALQTDTDNSIDWGYDGIIYAADMGADVISNSWGGISHEYFSFIADVIAYANGKGSILVFAAGNDSYNGFFFPADYPGAVAVASVNGDDSKVSYSNYGLAIDVCAPGGGLEGGILSTWTGNSYELGFGTSMATPLVAGLMGLVKSYHPEWTADQVVAQVIATCDNIDGLNPQFETLLGNGRINAFQALAMPAMAPPQLLKLEMMGCSVTDADNDGILMPGDTGIISLKVRNYAFGVSSDAVTFTLTSDDEQLELFDATFTGTIYNDSIFDLDHILRFKVMPQATSHVAGLSLTITADVPVLVDEEWVIPVAVAPSGFFVYEKSWHARDNSGLFMKNYLEDKGYPVTYANHFPQSMIGFDAVFLSMGNLVQPYWDPGTYLSEEMVQVLVDYLESGGRMYIEGAGVFLIPKWNDYANKETLENLFGINAVGYADKNPINQLTGVSGTLCEGMAFSASRQYYNNWIEMIFPKAGVLCPLEESNHGKVAIYNSGSYGQKTFYFAYSLSDLVDVDKTSCRYNLMNKVMEALGYPPPAGFMMAYLTSDVTSGGPATEVSFTSLCVSAPEVTAGSWAWDFQNDGIIDSYQKNPKFTFTQQGTYDVRHITANTTISDTIIMPGYYTVNKGMLVYESLEGCRDMSGAWIRDFLLENDYAVTYVNEVPREIKGYDALFLSFGNTSSFGSVFEDGFVRLLKDYLEKGGNIYLEGGSALGGDQNNALTRQMFGLENAVSPANPFTYFDTIAGVPGSICEGMSFNNTNQLGTYFTDYYNPGETGIAAITQEGFGDVAVQHTGPKGEKTVCFSYILAELQDGATTREDLMWAILNYFDVVTGAMDLEVPVSSLQIRAFPVPATGSLTLSWNLPETGQVFIEVYDLSGRMIFRDDFGCLAGGTHQRKLNLNAPAGIYLLKLRAEHQNEIIKIVLTNNHQ